MSHLLASYSAAARRRPPGARPAEKSTSRLGQAPQARARAAARGSCGASSTPTNSKRASKILWTFTSTLK